MARPLGIAALLLALAECAPPTLVRVDVHSELACGRGSPAAILVGARLEELAGKAPSSTSVTCEPEPWGGAHLGTVVLAPAGDPDAPLALAVAQRDDASPADACTHADLTADARARCVVAYRQLRTERAEALDLRIDLRLACLNATCAPGQTCAQGRCVDATCAGNCPERGLVPAAFPPAGFGTAYEIVRPPLVPTVLAMGPHWLYFCTRELCYSPSRRSPALPPGAARTSTQDAAFVGDRLFTLEQGVLADESRTPFALLEGALRMVVTANHAWVAFKQSEQAGVQRFDLPSGLGVGERIASAARSAGMPPFAADGDLLVWAEDSTVFAHHARLSDRVEIARAPAPVVDVATDGEQVVWLGADGTLSQVSSAGGSVEVIQRGIHVGTRVVMDATRVYWLEGARAGIPGAVRTLPRAGGDATSLALGAPLATTLRVDAAGVYWIDEVTGGIWTAPKL